MAPIKSRHGTKKREDLKVVKKGTKKVAKPTAPPQTAVKATQAAAKAKPVSSTKAAKKTPQKATQGVSQEGEVRSNMAKRSGTLPHPSQWHIGSRIVALKYPDIMDNYDRRRAIPLSEFFTTQPEVCCTACFRSPGLDSLFLHGNGEFYCIDRDDCRAYQASKWGKKKDDEPDDEPVVKKDGAVKKAAAKKKASADKPARRKVRRPKK